MTVKKKKKSWILIDSNMNETIMDIDKYAIMHRVQIHARDLRILDPLLSYPSTILGRKGAIVLNLEHMKAIVTAEEVLLQDPSDDNVIPVVEELRRRLPVLNANKKKLGEKDESPFEFRALEVFLEAICSFHAARTTELETDAYPALDELTSKISSRNLDRVRKLKSAMTRLTARVQKLELYMSSGNVCISIYSLVTDIFGMKIPFAWDTNHGYTFKWVVILSGAFSAVLFLLIVSYARNKGLRR